MHKKYTNVRKGSPPLRNGIQTLKVIRNTGIFNKKHKKKTVITRHLYRKCLQLLFDKPIYSYHIKKGYVLSIIFYMTIHKVIRDALALL